MSKCLVIYCRNKCHSRGYCKTHYAFALREDARLYLNHAKWIKKQKNPWAWTKNPVSLSWNRSASKYVLQTEKGSVLYAGHYYGACLEWCKKHRCYVIPSTWEAFNRGGRLPLAEAPLREIAAKMYPNWRPKKCPACQGSGKLVTTTGDPKHPLRLVPCNYCSCKARN